MIHLLLIVLPFNLFNDRAILQYLLINNCADFGGSIAPDSLPVDIMRRTV